VQRSRAAGLQRRRDVEAERLRSFELRLGAHPAVLVSASATLRDAKFYPSLIMVRDQECSIISQKDLSHGPEPGKPHSRTRL
jgi:hypothetical protein